MYGFQGLGLRVGKVFNVYGLMAWGEQFRVRIFRVWSSEGRFGVCNLEAPCEP